MILVHGFGSDQDAFGNLADLLGRRPELDGWDIFGLSYKTGLMPDLRGVWAADPTIEMLGTYLSNRAKLKPLEGYGAIALVAHSMGGLVVQQALVDDDELADRASHVICMGTPSAGVPSARWGGFLKQQVGDMVENGSYILGLRSSWQRKFEKTRPFELLVVAGDRDAFVPASSSLDPFPSEARVVVPGSHVGIARIEASGSMSEQVLVECLVGDAAPGGPWNSARVAVEQHEFDRAVRELLPQAADLDEHHLVDLALALEGTDRRPEALALLKAHAGKHGTDAMGTLAGQLKRTWMAKGLRAEAESALDLYGQGLAQSESEQDHEQALYHAINVAFLELTYRDDPEAAAAAARTALEHCGQCPPGYWRSATEGEAYLYLGEWQASLRAYEQALDLEPSVHQIESSYAQAYGVAEELGPKDLEGDIDRIFRGGGPGTSQ